MANVTERIPAAQYWSLVSACRSSGSSRQVGRSKPRRNKFGNVRTASVDGADFDSSKESRTAAELELAKRAMDPSQRVVEVRRQQWFTVIEAQDGERKASYVADFVVTYADGRVEVVDTKSEITRKLPTYVLKRKLMLHVHGIRIREA